MRLAQLGMISGVVPIVLGQGVQRRDHFFPGTPGFVNPHQSLIRPLIIGIQLQHFFSRSDGATVLPFAGIHLAQIAESVYVFGILLQGFFEQTLSPVVLPFPGLLDALIVGCRSVSGHYVIT